VCESLCNPPAAAAGVDDEDCVHIRWRPRKLAEPALKIEHMFDSSGAVATLDASALTRLVTQIGADEPTGDPAEALRRIRALEELKSAAAAAQARQTAAFAETCESERQAAAVGHEVALAKRCSPFQGRRYLGWARILVGELPATLRTLQTGRVSEWRAMLVARETAWLAPQHRRLVDAELAPKLPAMGDREVVAEAKRIGYRLDPHGYVDRLRSAEADRRVTLRPAADAMARLTALLPVTQGVAVLAALSHAADTHMGDERSRGQVMADTLVERVTGQSVADRVPVTVNVVMTDQSLLHAGPLADEPGEVDGYGPVPAPMARDLATPPDEVPAWIRRLYADPAGRLVTMESTRRCFTPAQRDFVRLRDRHCRTPYCDAPIRHVDHVVAARLDGPTGLDNAQGLCEACNYAKEAIPQRSRAPAA
jgi:hypothetical protein